ncbi:DNA-binding protein [Quillaja saponaria]|uniref:DNA-binding protein n=1 Tax=Quillaja saponaria TaxID=32244 RepID=A0AAD7VF33_QUISA|nr:DNA-binding protein [Quillaja saponaria]
MNLPPPKPSTTPTATATNNTKTECNNCGSKNCWVLHSVQLRSIDRRLCTSCVLRLHPSSFCPFCFEFYENPLSSTSSASSYRYLSCIKCSSLAHVQCLPSPTLPPSSFLCPPCTKPNFSFFDIDNPNANSNGNSNRVIDKKMALVLLCAAKIACASMNKAVNTAKIKADRNAREAAVARKRAKDALEHLAVIEKARRTEGIVEVSGSGNLGTKEKEKIQKSSGLEASAKKDAIGRLTEHKVPLGSPKNRLSVSLQDDVMKNGASDSGVDRDCTLRSNGTVNEKGKCGNNGKLPNHDAGFKRLENNLGRLEDARPSSK